MSLPMIAMRGAAILGRGSKAGLASFSGLAASRSSASTVEGATRASIFAASTGPTITSLRNQSTIPKRRRRRIYEPARPLPTAEEAVNNILYNTPESPATPSQRAILNCLVTNEPGVLSRVSGILAARGFNIDSLVVAKTEVPDLSRMTIVLQGPDAQIEQARRQLEDLVPVWAVLDFTKSGVIEREMLMVKVSTVPGNLPEELSEEEEMVAGEHGTLNTEVGTPSVSEVQGSRRACEPRTLT